MGDQETYGCAVVGGYVYRGNKHYTLYGSYVLVTIAQTKSGY